MLTIGLLNRNTGDCRTSKKVNWKKDKDFKIYNDGYLGCLGSLKVSQNLTIIRLHNYDF